MSTIQAHEKPMLFYEMQPYGIKKRIVHWYHIGADGLSREVEILSEGLGEREELCSVRTKTFPWRVKGYRGWALAYLRLVPDWELWYTTEEHPEE